MTSRIVCTLDPHRLGPGLALGRGNLDVTTTDVCDSQRAVFGNVAIGAGIVAFTCYFWSKSRPAAGLVGLCSVGVAQVDGPLDQTVGLDVTTWGYLVPDAQVWNRHLISGTESPLLQPVAERMCIGVLVDMTVTPSPQIAWSVNGNLVFQADLEIDKFYLPAVSIGSDSPGDVTASLNFGQSLFDYPKFSVQK